MSHRTEAVRSRRSDIVRIARGMKRDDPHVRPAEIAAAVSAAGIRVSFPDVVEVLNRIGLHRR